MVFVVADEYVSALPPTRVRWLRWLMESVGTR
jgi:hypothetical protein